MLDKLLKDGQTDFQLVVFTIGSEEYALPITYIQEIITYQPLTKIPHSAATIEGVINLRGVVIPIIDGRKMVDCSVGEESSKRNKDDLRIIVIENEENRYGLIVDNVSEVTHMNSADVEQPPKEIGDNESSVWGVGKYNGNLIVLLDPSRIASFNHQNFSFNEAENKIEKEVKVEN